jgi:hypothetical protein
MVGHNVYAGLLTLLTGSIGDLISRIMWYNCSVSNIWTLLFMLPPLSIIPAGMYFFDKIEAGTNSCESSLDWFLLLLPITIICMAYLLGYVMDESSDALVYIVLLLVSFIIFSIARFYKNVQICDNNYPKTPPKEKQYIIDAVTKSAIGVGSAVILGIIAPYASYVPIIGVPFKILDWMGEIDGLQTGVIITVFHLIYNLYGNLPNNQKAICL